VRTIRTECRIAYTAGDTVDRHHRQRWCVAATDRPTQASVPLNATLVSPDDQYDSPTVATVDVRITLLFTRPLSAMKHTLVTCLALNSRNWMKQEHFDDGDYYDDDDRDESKF